MSARRLAWVAPVLSAALGAAAVALQILTPEERLPQEERLDLLDVLFALGFVGYAAVGALIAARHPRNAVGWLFCAVGIALPATGLLYAYATYGLVGTSDGLPGDELAAWGFSWSGDTLLILIVLLLLLFPTGRFLSRGWLRVGQCAAGVASVSALATALDPGPLYNFRTVANPLGVEGGGRVARRADDPALGPFALLRGRRDLGPGAVPRRRRHRAPADQVARRCAVPSPWCWSSRWA